MANIEPILISVEEACQLLNAGRTTFYQAVGSGRLKVRKLGRRTVVEMTELRRYVDTLPTMNK
ncbi:helix-turn-helix domain-containing protein [Aestuariivirga sp.]|uniref:helix-turn-helix domain-containing protein n=1 Tax=Aestuariivirga sp. TaxID=2650926 RepID=UPI0035949381